MRFLPSLSLVLSIGLYLTFLFLFLHHSEERTDERGKGDEMIAGEPMGRIAFFLLSVLCFQELEMGRDNVGEQGIPAVEDKDKEDAGNGKGKMKESQIKN